MEILTKENLRLRYDEVLEKIKDGAIFIYPTDTIYGIGCNALDKKAIEKIRTIKGRPDSPLSIWVPSIKWIKTNCDTKKAQGWLQKLPGPYTLILPLKNKNAVAENVTLTDSIGVRLPDHWFKKVVEDLNFPIITTSANKTGEPFMTSLEMLDSNIEKEVEFMIYEGEKNGRPSKLIHIGKEEVIER